MVNPDSPAFKFSEKIGTVIGFAIRWSLITGGLYLVGGLVNKLKLSSPNNPPRN